MTLTDLILRRFTPVFAPEDGTGTGAGEGTEGDAGKSETSSDADSQGTLLGGAKPDAGETSESGEGQTEGEGEGEGGDADTGGETGEGGDEGPPEDGKYTFELPEGMELDATLAEGLSPVLAELGLSNAQANKLAAAYIEAGEAQAQAQVDAWTKTNEEWVAQAKSDKVITEMGFDTAIERGNAALELFDPEGELTKALTTSAVNANHPALVRFMARAGAALANDKTETGTSGGGKEAPPEERWYPNAKG